MTVASQHCKLGTATKSAVAAAVVGIGGNNVSAIGLVDTVPVTWQHLHIVLVEDHRIGDDEQLLK